MVCEIVLPTSYGKNRYSIWFLSLISYIRTLQVHIIKHIFSTINGQFFPAMFDTSRNPHLDHLLSPQSWLPAGWARGRGRPRTGTGRPTRGIQLSTKDLCGFQWEQVVLRFNRLKYVDFTQISTRMSGFAFFLVWKQIEITRWQRKKITINHEIWECLILSHSNVSQTGGLPKIVWFYILLFRLAWWSSTDVPPGWSLKNIATRLAMRRAGGATNGVQ